jgi:hypothetical protein
MMPTEFDGRFRLDGASVDADTFRRAAIDPARSVVVDACAGSGKTTLLVARIVRALLEGAEPDQVLAVTFTRLAAHEMHERLVTELRALAVGDDAWLAARLAQDYGLGPARADQLAGRARGLYEAVLRHPRGPEITTFHRWFRTLASLGPLSTDTGEGSQLTEEAASLQQQAWFAWLDALRDPGRAARREDFERLVAAVGLSGTRRCLESLISQRTDWAVALGVDPDGPADALQAAADRAGAAYHRQWRGAAGALLGGEPPESPLDDVSTARICSLIEAHLGLLVSVCGSGLLRLTDAGRSKVSVARTLLPWPSSLSITTAGTWAITKLRDQWARGSLWVCCGL